MRYYLRGVLVVWLSLSACQLYCQTPRPDTLLVQLADRSLPDSARTEVLIQLAKIYSQEIGDYDSASTLFDQAIQLAEENQFHGQHIEALMGKGVVLYYSYNNRSEGLELYQRSYVLAQQHRLNHKLSRINYALGIANDHMLNYALAESYFLKAAELASEEQNEIDRIKAIRALSSFYRARGEVTKATEYNRQIEDIIRTTANPSVLENAWSFISDREEADNNLAAAVSAREKALQNIKRTGRQIDIAMVIVRLAELCLKAGQSERTRELFEEMKAYQNIRNHSIQSGISKMHRLMARILEAEGNFKEALEFEQQANELYEDVLTIKLTDQLTDAQIRFESARKENELALQAAKLENRNFALVMLGLALGGGLITLVIIFRFWQIRKRLSQELMRQNQQLERQKMEIERKQEELAYSNRQLVDLNDSLDRRVKENTAELIAKNKKLTEYAFVNAHSLRGPLARILGLIQVIRLTGTTDEQRHILALLEESSLELDQIIHKIRDMVDQE